MEVLIMKLPFIQGDNNKEQVIEISIEDVVNNPYQPRVDFNDEEINELAHSIKNYGVIQPILVRNRGEKFELIAGERRLRACKRIGLKKVPAVIREITEKEMAEIALVENLQRKDLNFLEEAHAYQRLLNEFSMTQQELAEKIGKSQSTIANKLRLLSLPADVCQAMDLAYISERHARALLKLKEKGDQLQALKEIIQKELTVKETEKLVEKMLAGEEKRSKVITYYKDLRIFTNTIKNTVDEMRKAGLDVKMEKVEKEDFLEFTIRLPKKK